MGKPLPLPFVVAVTVSLDGADVVNIKLESEARAVARWPDGVC